MRLLGAVAALLASAVALPGPALAQIGIGDYGVNDYEMQYGEPVDVTIESLSFMPESYYEKAVRVSGKLDALASTHGSALRLGHRSQQLHGRTNRRWQLRRRPQPRHRQLRRSTSRPRYVRQSGSPSAWRARLRTVPTHRHSSGRRRLLRPSWWRRRSSNLKQRPHGE